MLKARKFHLFFGFVFFLTGQNGREQSDLLPLQHLTCCLQSLYGHFQGYSAFHKPSENRMARDN